MALLPLVAHAVRVEESTGPEYSSITLDYPHAYNKTVSSEDETYVSLTT